MGTVYVLKLTQGKYYVGYTDDLDVRLTNHKLGVGSKWTQTYKMERVLKLYRNMTKRDEDRITLEMMNKFGYENVRGGSWSQMTLRSNPTKGKSPNKTKQPTKSKPYKKTSGSKLCGARTQDGGKCRYPAWKCPHH